MTAESVAGRACNMPERRSSLTQDSERARQTGARRRGERRGEGWRGTIWADGLVGCVGTGGGEIPAVGSGGWSFAAANAFAGRRRAALAGARLSPGAVCFGVWAWARRAWEGGLRRAIGALHDFSVACSTTAVLSHSVPPYLLAGALFILVSVRGRPLYFASRSFLRGERWGTGGGLRVFDSLRPSAARSRDGLRPNGRPAGQPAGFSRMRRRRRLLDGLQPYSPVQQRPCRSGHDAAAAAAGAAGFDAAGSQAPHRATADSLDSAAIPPATHIHVHT